MQMNPKKLNEVEKIAYGMLRDISIYIHDDRNLPVIDVIFTKEEKERLKKIFYLLGLIPQRKDIILSNPMSYKTLTRKLNVEQEVLNRSIDTADEKLLTMSLKIMRTYIEEIRIIFSHGTEQYRINF